MPCGAPELVHALDERRRKAVLAAAQQADPSSYLRCCPSTPLRAADSHCRRRRRVSCDRRWLHDGLQVARLAIHRELTVGAGALAQHGVDVVRPRARLPSSSTTSSTNSSSSSARSRIGTSARLPKSISLPSSPSAPRATCSPRSARGGTAGSPGSACSSRCSLTTIAWHSAPSMTASSGRVGTSQTRNSSVPNVGCGRTSHQIFLRVVDAVQIDEQLECSSRTRSTSRSDRGRRCAGNRRKIVVRYDFSPVSRPIQNGELVESASRCGRK